MALRHIIIRYEKRETDRHAASARHARGGMKGVLSGALACRLVDGVVRVPSGR